jgi:hypothetical protein
MIICMHGSSIFRLCISCSILSLEVSHILRYEMIWAPFSSFHQAIVVLVICIRYPGEVLAHHLHIKRLLVRLRHDRLFLKLVILPLRSFLKIDRFWCSLRHEVNVAQRFWATLWGHRGEVLMLLVRYLILRLYLYIFNNLSFLCHFIGYWNAIYLMVVDVIQGLCIELEQFCRVVLLILLVQWLFVHRKATDNSIFLVWLLSQFLLLKVLVF